jgi:hypothetical protein
MIIPITFTHTRNLPPIHIEVRTCDVFSHAQLTSVKKELEDRIRAVIAELVADRE